MRPEHESHERVWLYCIASAHVSDMERTRLCSCEASEYANNTRGYGWNKEEQVSYSGNEATMNTDERRAPVDEAPVNEALREGGRIRKPPKRYGCDEFSDIVTLIIIVCCETEYESLLEKEK